MQTQAQQVEAVRRIPYQGMVHNLEVAEDESFLLNGLVVHNCIWVYIGKDEEGFQVTWEDPSADLVASHGGLVPTKGGGE